jgi:hypothetical protein
MERLILTQTKGGMYDSTPQADEVYACINQLTHPNEWERIVRFYRDRAQEEGLLNVKKAAAYCIEHDIAPESFLKHTEWEEV